MKSNSPTDSSQLLAELESSLQESQEAVLSRDLDRIHELTVKQGLLLDAMQGWKVADDGDLRAQAARVLHLGRVQSGILQRWQRRLRMLSNFRAGIDSMYEAEPGSQGVIVRQSTALREA